MCVFLHVYDLGKVYALCQHLFGVCIVLTVGFKDNDTSTVYMSTPDVMMCVFRQFN